MGYFTCDVHEIFESKIHAELKQSRKQHNRPTFLPLSPNFFFFKTTVTSLVRTGERRNKTDKGKKPRTDVRISRVKRDIEGVRAPRTEYMHELELDSLESKNTN